jgi:hypothetical protein
MLLGYLIAIQIAMMATRGRPLPLTANAYFAIFPATKHEHTGFTLDRPGFIGNHIDSRIKAVMTLTGRADLCAGTKAAQVHENRSRAHGVQ